MTRAERRRQARAAQKPPAVAPARLDPLGTVAVLNVGHGDLTLRFDSTKEAEREHAKTVVTDMLARGYAILVQVGEKDGEPIYQRAKGFDPETSEYLIVGAPAEAEPIPKPSRPRSKARGLKTTRVPASRTRAVAVARTAGG